jgi:DNA polymerase (family 10)
MENEAIVEQLELLVKLWDLHGINEFKSKNLAFATRGLDKYPLSICQATEEQLLAIPGVGKVVISIIKEVAQTGTCIDLEGILEQTPSGLLNLLKIKGLGPKKVSTIWKELGISDIDELLLACQNNQLVQLKGFSSAIQENVYHYILFLKQNASKLRLDKAHSVAKELITILSAKYEKVQIVGDLARNCEEIASIDCMVLASNTFGAAFALSEIEVLKEDYQNSSPFVWRGNLVNHLIPIQIYFVDSENWAIQSLKLSSHPNHLALIGFDELKLKASFESEHAIYQYLQVPYIIPNMREGLTELKWAITHQETDLIQLEDLKGCVHNHSTYSDGKNSLFEMAEACRQMGLSYFGIADHSQYAAYAGGLKPERISDQHLEIDQLNKNWTNFRILKGIEADILPDGSLDYDASILSSFDYVVASVHARLQMDEEKAMARLLKAIENPFTTILGHPTGRLLLARQGYPLQMSKIIDACAANRVVIELNASPYRLDLDWRFIDLAQEKGVMISINPDAHEIAGLMDMKYGVEIARKGGLLKNNTFNALNVDEFLQFKNGFK